MKDTQLQNLEIAYTYLQGLMTTIILSHSEASKRQRFLLKQHAVEFTCNKFGVTRPDLIGLDRLKFPVNIGGHISGHFDNELINK